MSGVDEKLDANELFEAVVNGRESGGRDVCLIDLLLVKE